MSNTVPGLSEAATEPPQQERAGFITRIALGVKGVFEALFILIFLPLVEQMIKVFSKQGRNRFYDPYQFRWVKELENNVDIIRSELNGVLDLNNRDCLPSMRDFLFYKSKSTATLGNWKVYIFSFFGRRFETNCARCPKTTELISRIPNVTGAMFSVLNARQQIYQHRGFLKGVLRLHIGLKVPDPPESCGFKLDGKTVHWELGKSFMFDQTYRHEAWNNSDQVRIVLLLDVLRPLPFPLHQLNSLLVRIGGDSFIGSRMSQIVERWTTKYPQAGRKAEAVRSPK